MALLGPVADADSDSSKRRARERSATEAAEEVDSNTRHPSGVSIAGEVVEGGKPRKVSFERSCTAVVGTRILTPLQSETRLPEQITWN